MTPTEVQVTRQGPVTIVTINRQQARNAVDRVTAQQLADAFRDFEADPDAAVMVINRPLQEILEGTAYTAITDTLQTAVSSSLPEEMRWLSMYEEMAWPGLPVSFREHFAVVAERIELAQRWIHAPVVSQLLNAVEGEGGSERAKSRTVRLRSAKDGAEVI